MDFTYSYVGTNGHNNGNVPSITETNGDGDDTQNFTYDSLNRIATAQTSAINQPGWAGDTGHLQECWAEQYSYDPWGNLVSIAPSSSSSYTGCIQESGFNFTGSIGTNNRITASGYMYDSAGNLIAAPPTGPTYTYDAENHLISTGGQTYLYDGDGKRVEKGSGSPLVANKLYWYGTEDSPVIETDASGNELYRYFRFNGILTTREEANDWVDHYGLDALGNVRWLYSYNGAWDVSDYYPFGGERLIYSTSAGNNTRLFTSKERDSESGNDNFGARYYSSPLGRFTSPDPENAGASPASPQSWNAYSYVLNNPLKYVDPFGLDCVYLGDDGSHSGWIKSGDCVSETDSGYYVNGSINGAVYNRVMDLTNSGITFPNENWMTYGYKHGDRPFVNTVGGQCIGDCPNQAAIVPGGSSGVPTMSATPIGLPPSNLKKYEPAAQADFDLWHMTPQQGSDVQACMATGGEYDSSDLKQAAFARAAAQVRGPKGKPAKYGNNKPIIPNIQGAKRAPNAGAITGAVGLIGGALGCVNNLANK
jgi:RHS repeat-associated protein